MSPTNEGKAETCILSEKEERRYGQNGIYVNFPTFRPYHDCAFQLATSASMLNDSAQL